MKPNKKNKPKITKPEIPEIPEIAPIKIKKKRLTIAEAKTLITSFDKSSLKKILAILAKDGLIAKCHWTCSRKNHGGIG